MDNAEPSINACAGDSLQIDLTRDKPDNSDTDSVLSLSDKIVIESNEKRLRKRMCALQTSITSLREELRAEKELWREDLEKIRQMQRQQQELNQSQHNFLEQQSRSQMLEHQRSYNYLDHESFKSDSLVSFQNTLELCNMTGTFRSVGHEILATKALKHLMEMENYKRKLAETETMCNVELSRVKQSLQDLSHLQSVASDWGRNKGGRNGGDQQNSANKGEKALEEIFVSNNSRE